MLYVKATGRYIRLSPAAAGLLDALDGETTTAQMLARVGGDADPDVAGGRAKRCWQPSTRCDASARLHLILAAILARNERGGGIGWLEPRGCESSGESTSWSQGPRS